MSMMGSSPILICLFVANLVAGEYVTANVTKSTIPTRKPSNSSFTFTTTMRPVVVRTSMRPENSFNAAPKAVSVDADMRNYAAFPIPASFPFPGSDGVEETFTYQVTKTKQRTPPMVPTNSSMNWKEEFDFLQKRARSESYKILQDYVSELHFQMDAKIRNVSDVAGKIGLEAQRNNTLLNSVLKHLNQEVANSMSSSQETIRIMKLMQHNFDQEKATLLTKISEITTQVERLQNEKANEMNRLKETTSKLQAKLDNTTMQIRVHDAYLRFGQNTMASIKSSIDQNLERISELEVSGGPQWTEQTVGCGGVLVANSGIISYKYREQYFNNERCVWIVRTNRRSQINLQLLDDGFQNQSNSDFLTVTELLSTEDQHPATLITSSRLEHGNKALHTFQGPVIFITFYSDGSHQGTGFTLRFNGIGNSSDPTNLNAIRHLNLHLSEPIGVFSYPPENTGTWYQPNELVTIAINPVNASSVKIQMNRSDLEMDENCEFDSISFYGSVTGSYALTKRYCQHYENFMAEIIKSSDGIFLVIFRSDASTQFSGFQFSWEID